MPEEKGTSMSSVSIFYMNGSHIWAETQNATIIPRVGEYALMNGLKVVIKEVIWHLENPMWVEIQVERA